MWHEYEYSVRQTRAAHRSHLQDLLAEADQAAAAQLREVATPRPPSPEQTPAPEVPRAPTPPVVTPGDFPETPARARPPPPPSSSSRSGMSENPAGPSGPPNPRDDDDVARNIITQMADAIRLLAERAAAPPAAKKAEIPLPEPFDGTASDYLRWKTQVSNYVRAAVRTHRLSTAEETIELLLSNLSGDAAKWAAYLEVPEERDPSIPRRDYDEDLQEFVLDAPTGGLRWLLNLLDERYPANVLRNSATRRLLTMKQGELDFSAFLREFELTFRHSRGASWAAHDALTEEIFLKALRPELRLALQTKVSSFEVSRAALLQYGPFLDQVTPRPARPAPRSSRSAAPVPSAAREGRITNTHVVRHDDGRSSRWKDHLSEEDSALVLEKRVCSWCYSQAHRARDCPKSSPVQMNEGIRTRLRAVVPRPRINLRLPAASSAPAPSPPSPSVPALPAPAAPSRVARSRAPRSSKSRVRFSRRSRSDEWEDCPPSPPRARSPSPPPGPRISPA